MSCLMITMAMGQIIPHCPPKIVDSHPPIAAYDHKIPARQYPAMQYSAVYIYIYYIIYYIILYYIYTRVYCLVHMD